MRILHVITRMDGGGSAVNTLISATAQARAGHDVTLAFGPSLESDMSAIERRKVNEGLHAFRDAGGRVEIIPSLLRRPGLHDWRAWRRLRGLLRQGFDIVHTHTSKAGALGRLAADIDSARLVHTPHGHIFHGYFGRLKSLVFLQVERYLAHRTHALIALTKAEMRDHLQLGVGRPEQWHVIPSGVDIDAIATGVRALRRQNPQRQWTAVSVGRLVPVKGMDRLLAAWAGVCRRRPDARLAIIGDGPERQRLEALRKDWGLERQVHFAGWRDPIPYLAASRCFVLLSRNEGMGRAVVEAMAAGLPCVVADVCGLTELVTPAVGVRVDADDANAVAAALLEGVHDAMGEAAAERARDFGVEAMVDALERLYARLLAA